MNHDNIRLRGELDTIQVDKDQLQLQQDGHLSRIRDLQVQVEQIDVGLRDSQAQNEALKATLRDADEKKIALERRDFEMANENNQLRE